MAVPLIAQLRGLASVPALTPDEELQSRRAAHAIGVAPASERSGHETGQHADRHEDRHEAQSDSFGCRRAAAAAAAAAGAGAGAGGGDGAGAGGGDGGRGHGRWSQFFMQLDGLSGALEFGAGVDDAANLEQARLRAARIFGMLQLVPELMLPHGHGHGARGGVTIGRDRLLGWSAARTG